MMESLNVQRRKILDGVWLVVGGLDHSAYRTHVYLDSQLLKLFQNLIKKADDPPHPQVNMNLKI